MAFSVRLHEDTVLSDSACIFGTVDLNIGDDYDEFTGKERHSGQTDCKIKQKSWTSVVLFVTVWEKK